MKEILQITYKPTVKNLDPLFIKTGIKYPPYLYKIFEYFQLKGVPKEFNESKMTATLNYIDKQGGIPEGMSENEAIDILRILIAQFSVKYSILKKITEPDELLSECFFNVKMPRPCGFSLLEQFDPNKIHGSKEGFLRRSMGNKILDLLRSHKCRKKFITLENQLSEMDLEYPSYYDFLTEENDDPIINIIAKETFKCLPRNSKSDRIKPTIVEGIGEVTYCQYWVMVLYTRGYDSKTIASMFKNSKGDSISTASISKMISTARILLEQSYGKFEIPARKEKIVRKDKSTEEFDLIEDIEEKEEALNVL
jgi:hypothetical protein